MIRYLIISCILFIPTIYAHGGIDDGDEDISSGIYSVSSEYIPLDIMTVVYTSTGYVPNSLHVQPGQTVVFSNTTSQKIWTASDPHPTHTDYSVFDARKGYSSGEVYVYTFTGVGVYPYHDHLFPARYGEIVVGDISTPPSPVRKLRIDVLSALDPADPSSITRTMDILVQAVDREPKLIPMCHQIGHEIGYNAYSMYWLEKSIQYGVLDAVGMDDCHVGVMHATIQSAMLDHPEYYTRPAALCTDMVYTNSKSKSTQGRCFHGVGHAYMYDTQSMQKSSYMCDKNIPWPNIYDCKYGLYMEYFIGESTLLNGVIRQTLDKSMFKNISYMKNICYNKNTQKYDDGCLYFALFYTYGYRSMSSQIDIHTQNVWFCTQILDSTMRSECLHVVGMRVHGMGISAQQSIVYCENLSADDTISCMYGLLMGTYTDATPASKRKRKDICDTIQNPYITGRLSCGRYPYFSK